MSVSIGDRVRLQGTVSEYASSGVTLTEIGALQNKLVCGTGNPFQVTTITLPTAAAGDLERYEGMAVKLTQQLLVTGNYNLAKYNEVDLAPKLLFQPTQMGDPATWADAADLNKRSVLTLSNGRTDSNVYPTIYPQGGLTAANTLRVGALVNYDTVSKSNTTAHRCSRPAFRRIPAATDRDTGHLLQCQSAAGRHHVPRDGGRTLPSGER